MKWGWLALGILAAGCSHQAPGIAKFAELPPDPWVLVCDDALSPVPALLWNGIIGVRIDRSGFGSAPFLKIDGYETAGEEKILPFPNPLGGSIRINGTLVAPTPRYRQSLDMRTGMLTTTWQQPFGTDGLQTVTVETVLDPLTAQISQRWGVTHARPSVSRPCKVELKFWAPTIARNGGWSMTDHDGVRAMVQGSLGQSRFPSKALVKVIDGINAAVQVRAGEITANCTDTSQDLAVFERTVTFGGAAAPSPMSFDEVARKAAGYWAGQWKTDIEIDGPVTDQRAIRSLLFYLRSSIAPGGQMAVSPFGLSDPKYNGHVFWDADIWVFPALALVDPRAAKAIPNYRARMARQAESNYAAWLSAGRPTAGGRLGPAPSALAAGKGAKFPWESSVSGRETVVGPSKFEDHISGSVLWGLNQAQELGLAQVGALGGEVAEFYRARATKTPRGLEIRSVMSPDENHIGDNDLYTNLIASWALSGMRWPSAAYPVVLPRDGISLLSYDGDLLRGYKQAAAVLGIYPLQAPVAEAEAAVMMQRFPPKTSPNGPAMSDSVHSIIWARMGDTDRAYSAWERSWGDFTRAPLMLFSEKRSRPEAYFTTGAAGSLQSVVYGFLGFRIDSQKAQGAVWARKLMGDAWLSLKPNLPSQWRSVKFSNFSVLGKRYTLEVVRGGKCTVTQNP